jgi:CRISPR/Cas system-associated exonuclease Cas4 (RecB family)
MRDVAVVRASDVGEYTYCARAWWLRHVRGVPSSHGTLMRDGTRQHRSHACRVATSIWLRRLAWSAIVVAALILLTALVGVALGG